MYVSALHSSSLSHEPIYAGIAQREVEHLIEQGYEWDDEQGWLEDEGDRVVHMFETDTPLHDAHMRAQADEIDALNLLPF